MLKVKIFFQIFGRCEDDMKNQMYFCEKALQFQSSEFPDIVKSFCEGREKLELVEEGKEEVHFEKSKFFFA